MTLSGIWAAAVTPVHADLQPDAERAVIYYGELLDSGCSGINLLGTTGEAMSFSVQQRVGLMQAITASGLPRERFMTGTGAASLDDAVSLNVAAHACGFAASLVMPPFFYRDAGDDGVVAWFDALLSRTAGRQLPILLYNFPKMSGTTFGVELTGTLIERFGSIIAGIKDSSNDQQLQRDLIAAFPQLRVFPGSEGYLTHARGYGAAGCISGTVALWPALARDVWNGNDASSAELTRLRDSVGHPLIANVRARIAQARKDDAWLRAVPPL
jgi:4-hydroxy-tetrahydrodipicolinate synthase